MGYRLTELLDEGDDRQKENLGIAIIIAVIVVAVALGSGWWREYDASHQPPTYDCPAEDDVLLEVHAQQFAWDDGQMVCVHVDLIHTATMENE